MKPVCLIVLLCAMSYTYSQNTRREQRSVIEDGLVKTWLIEKEYDQQGNLMNYDSTYSEQPMGESGSSFHWGSGDLQFDFNQNGIGQIAPFYDSLNSSGFHFDIDKIIQNYQEQLERSINISPSDSTNSQDIFIYPEDKKTLKKI